MEKDTAVSSEDYGHDLASVQALVRRHEGFEVGKCFLNFVCCCVWVFFFFILWCPFLCQSEIRALTVVTH